MFPNPDPRNYCPNSPGRNRPPLNAPPQRLPGIEPRQPIRDVVLDVLPGPPISISNEGAKNISRHLINRQLAQALQNLGELTLMNSHSQNFQLRLDLDKPVTLNGLMEMDDVNLLKICNYYNFIPTQTRRPLYLRSIRKKDQNFSGFSSSSSGSGSGGYYQRPNNVVLPDCIPLPSSSRPLNCSLLAPQNVILKYQDYQEERRRNSGLKHIDPSTICIYCYQNNESVEMYESHLVRNHEGLITCPVLRNMLKLNII